uniref:Methyltransferase-like 26 n=1 Tax=Gopherus evgoodei TaxID=1825980 RepID=A0A8C4Y6I1_9SAUR
MVVSSMAERNKELILEVLADYVDNTSQAFGLELASGTGQHVVHFAQALPNVTWQPSEVSPSFTCLSSSSISAYIRATKVQNVKTPLAIDVSQPWDQRAGLSKGCCNVIVIIHLLHFLAQGLEMCMCGQTKARSDSDCTSCLQPFAISGIISPECNIRSWRRSSRRGERVPQELNSSQGLQQFCIVVGSGWPAP